MLGQGIRFKIVNKTLHILVNVRGAESKEVRE